MKKFALAFAAFILLLSSNVKGQTLNEALRFTDNEQYDVADGVYESLISKEPANGTYWFYFGENFWRWENPDSAKICYQKGIEAEPANPLNYVGIGKTFLEQNNTTEAKTNFDKALSMAGPKLNLVQTKIAEAYIRSAKNKNIEYALSLLNKVVTADPKNIEAFILIGDSHAELNDGTTAAMNYNRALELDRKSAKAVMRKGILYKRTMNYETARSEFENAMAIDSMFAPAHRELGEIFFRLRKLERAKEEYKKYLELSKNTSGARLRYASFLFASKDYNSTLNELNQLTKLDPKNISLLRLSAYTYFEMGDNVRASEKITEVFNQVPEEKRTPRDYEYYSKILSKDGKDSLAVLMMEKAFELDSTNTDLLPDMGAIYMKIKDYPKAISAFERKIEFSRATSTDYFNLGKAYSTAKEFYKADTAFAKFNELQPNWANGFLWRAKVNANIDSTSQNGLAKPFYDKYLELALPDTANFGKNKKDIIEAYKYLMYYHFLQDQIKEAIGMCRKVLEIDPNDEQAKKTLEGLTQPKK